MLGAGFIHLLSDMASKLVKTHRYFESFLGAQAVVIDFHS